MKVGPIGGVLDGAVPSASVCVCVCPEIHQGAFTVTLCVPCNHLQGERRAPSAFSPSAF